jgi:RhtB (resistance to homoserine/threonine) family protein
MEYLPLIGTVFVLNLLAAVSPGPDFVITVRNSLCYSRRSGIFTGFGIVAGLLVHLFYCAAGIGFIISRSELLFTLIKVVGAGYLIYMGISAFISMKSKLDLSGENEGSDLTRFKAFRMGFLTNVLNPKATLFFLSLFSFVIGNETPVYIILIISLVIVLTALAWFIIVSVFFTQKKVQNAFLRYEVVINRILGGFLVLLGVKVALLLR